MAAVLEINTYHGAPTGAAGADVTSTTIRMKKADNNTQDANDPVVIPAAGYNYSWRKSVKLQATTGPDNEIRNLRFYSEGQSLGTGRTLLVNTDATYEQASASDESAAISATDVDTHTTGSPLTITAGQVLGAAATGTGTQDFVELQLRVASTATQGNADNAKTLVYRYDES